MRNPQRWVRNEVPFCCGVVVEERQRRVSQRLKNRRERCQRLSWHLRDLRFRRGSPYLVFLPFSPSHRRNSDFGLCEPAWRCIHRRCVGGIRVPCDVDAYSRCMSRGGCLCLAFVQGRCAHSNTGFEHRDRQIGQESLLTLKPGAEYILWEGIGEYRD
jgi:hypothetical protein